MTHIELIKLIYKERKTLDKLYKRQENIFNQNLETAGVSRKVAQRVELSPSYRNFVDTTLNRVDYGIIFNSYQSELDTLITYKKRYLKEEKAHYLDDILKLIETIFFTLEARDKEIRLLLVKIENETALELDILIEKAMDILEKIEEIGVANREVKACLENEIYAISLETKALIDMLSPQILDFVENIFLNLNRIKQFIARTRKLRLQNKKLFALAVDIVNEKDEALEQLLRLEPKKCYMTMKRSQRVSIKSYPDDSENRRVLSKLRKEIFTMEVKKPLRALQIETPKEEFLPLVNIAKIEAFLEKEGSEDIFLSIYTHEELHKYIALVENSSLKEESFKIYLQFIIPFNQHINITNQFNQHSIRIAQWI